MRVRAKWVEGVSFVGETGSGHSVVTDGAPDAGGRNIGMRPMELLLLGAATCTAFDLVLILKKARQPIADCVVEAEAEGGAHLGLAVEARRHPGDHGAHGPAHSSAAATMPW